jgi:WhiB family redox-sensing transcriptional regulator
MDKKRAQEGGGVDETPTIQELFKFLRLPYPTYIEDGGWRDYALCKGMGNDDFFGDVKDFRNRSIRVARAKAVCKKCSVRKECFNYAKKNNERHGVWGGVDFHVSSKTKYRHHRDIPDTID